MAGQSDVDPAQSTADAALLASTTAPTTKPAETN